MKRKTVLVVAAHPDDEVLGCGGTIASHIQAGDAVHVLILAEGLTSRDAKRDRGKRAQEFTGLHQSAKKAHQILGTTSLTLESLPDNRMDSVNLIDVVKIVEKKIAKVKPSIVYTHHLSDLNIDHQITNRAVLTAARPIPGQSVKEIWTFEVASSSEWKSQTLPPFQPQLYRDISATFPLKLKALKAYASEMRPWPHARSIEALEHLAKLRGSQSGIRAAEAFMLERMISSN